ncbi:hypothetical protein ASE63_05805 [Bosea sp. Root381]|uniref:right-handed parallel beta-helix repeat-containing protein n=1 Tax=Bosea sp. Root381 TaxID=1736524 RepID=UPI0006FA9F99|nr:right-handed parallel beta-helix repeat-containing protein [Bosea sp. Root381]KRE05835.1 hypothetical protein ASE63_05805 [Bosea sp. Root381]
MKALAATVVLLLLGAIPLEAAPDAGSACPADAARIPPGQSLAEAAARAPPGAGFCIAAGIHRMQVVRPKTGQRFFGESGAILNGARVLTEFRQVAGGWVAAGQAPTGELRGVCEPGHEGCELPVGVFLDGEPLRRVASRSGLRPGSFFHDQASRDIVLADAPQGRLVEVSTATHAFIGATDAVLIRGLVVEKYFNPAQEGAIRGDGRGWRIEHSELRLNSGAGVSVGHDGVVADCNIHHNGQIGVTADGTNIVIEANEIWNNNIFGFATEWDAGGLKITESSDLFIRNNYVHHNVGPGLWCDERCINVLFEGNRIEFNRGAGIFFELSSRTVIRGNQLRENNQGGAGWFWGGEIQIAASEYADIHDNTLIVRNPGRGVMLIDQNRWKVGGGFYKTRGNHVHRNDITFLGEGAAGGVSVGNPLAENYAIISKGGNIFDQNTYRYRGREAPVFAWDTLRTDFAGFRRRGQEANGTLIAEKPGGP